jgi:hypothetical protein
MKAVPNQDGSAKVGFCPRLEPREPMNPSLGDVRVTLAARFRNQVFLSISMD